MGPNILLVHYIITPSILPSQSSSSTSCLMLKGASRHPSYPINKRTYSPFTFFPLNCYAKKRVAIQQKSRWSECQLPSITRRGFPAALGARTTTTTRTSNASEDYPDSPQQQAEREVLCSSNQLLRVTLSAPVSNQAHPHLTGQPSMPVPHAHSTQSQITLAAIPAIQLLFPFLHFQLLHQIYVPCSLQTSSIIWRISSRCP